MNIVYKANTTSIFRLLHVNVLFVKLDEFTIITHQWWLLSYSTKFSPMLYFCTRFYKSFLCCIWFFFGGIEMEHWVELGQIHKNYRNTIRCILLTWCYHLVNSSSRILFLIYIFFQHFSWQFPVCRFHQLLMFYSILGTLDFTAITLPKIGLNQTKNKS